MAVGDPRARASPSGRRPAAGVGELEADDELVGAPERSVGVAQRRPSVVDASWLVDARAGWGWPGRRGARRRPRRPRRARRPLAPKRRQRRRTRSVGRPSVVPSQPSIGQDGEAVADACSVPADPSANVDRRRRARRRVDRRRRPGSSTPSSSRRSRRCVERARACLTCGWRRHAGSSPAVPRRSAMSARTSRSASGRRGAPGRGGVAARPSPRSSRNMAASWR